MLYRHFVAAAKLLRLFGKARGKAADTDFFTAVLIAEFSHKAAGVAVAVHIQLGKVFKAVLLIVPKVKCCNVFFLFPAYKIL